MSELTQPASTASTSVVHESCAYTDAVDYGTQRISFRVQRSDRSTLGIHVHPDGTVEVHAPHKAAPSAIRRAVKKRARWITKQQRELNALVMPTGAPKEYVAGETHWYLGRQYRIQLKDLAADNADESVRLSGTFLRVATRQGDDPSRTKRLVKTWFRERAEAELPRYFEWAAEKVHPYGIEATEMQVYAMQKRWGSCTASRRILLNPELIHAAPYAIEYVVVHELCHLKHPHHDDAFYDLLSRLLPSWRDRKAALEKTQIGR